MFKSKKRKIIITQADHAKLSGVLAQNWGNENFDKPVIDFDAFVRGVTLHDIAYGDYDNYPIGAVSKEQWAKLTLAASKYRFENPVTDIVTKLHLKRLLNDDDMFKEEILCNIDKRIEESLRATKFSIKDFIWADCITDFCDWVSFNFCIEKEFEDTIEVYTHRNSSSKVAIKFHTSAEGVIIVEPWPFFAETIQGSIIAYNEMGYPKELKTILKNYLIIPQKILH